MDEETLAKAKKYTDSQRLAYSEKNVFTFDGNAEGKQKFPNGSLYKISAKTPDTSTLIRVVGNVSGVMGEISAEHLTIEVYDMAHLIWATIYGQRVLTAAIVYADPDVSDEYIGLYAFSYDGDYLALIEFADTIHPISDKYLPGVCLPVVEITSVNMGEIAYDPLPLSESESEIMEKIVASGAKYLLAHIYLGEYPSTAILPVSYDDGGVICGYIGLLASAIIAIAKNEGTWFILKEII